MFLHVATAFAVVAVHSGSMALVAAAIWAGEDGTAASIAKLYGRVGGIVPPLGILAAVFGLMAAAAGSVNLAAPWLLIAYGLFVAMTAFGGIVSVPAMAHVAAARGGGPTNRADVRSQLVAIVAVDTLIVGLIIADMVVKPLS